MKKFASALVLTGLLLTRATAAAAAEASIEYRLSTALVNKNAADGVLESVQQERTLSLATLSEDPDGNRILKLGMRVNRTPLHDAAARAPELADAEQFLAVDRQGRLLTALTMAPGQVIRAADVEGACLAGAQRPGSVPEEGRWVEIQWPTGKGEHFPVRMHLSPGEEHGTGGAACRTIKLSLSGRHSLHGQAGLILEGEGRIVLARLDDAIVAIDLRLSCLAADAQARPRAVAEARIELRLNDPRFQDLPETGFLPAPPARSGGVLAGGSEPDSGTPWGPSCLLGLLLLGGCGLCRRPDLLRQGLFLALIVSLALTGPALNVIASPQDIDAGAMGVVIGAGVVFLGIISFVPLAIAAPVGVVVGVAAYGTMRVIQNARHRAARVRLLEGSVVQRLEAIRDVARTGDVDQTPAIMYSARHDPVPEVRAAAVQAIGDLKVVSLADHLNDLKARDEDARVKGAVDDVLESWRIDGILRRLRRMGGVDR